MLKCYDSRLVGLVQGLAEHCSEVFCFVLFLSPMYILNESKYLETKATEKRKCCCTLLPVHLIRKNTLYMYVYGLRSPEFLLDFAAHTEKPTIHVLACCTQWIHFCGIRKVVDCKSKEKLNRKAAKILPGKFKPCLLRHPVSAPFVKTLMGSSRDADWKAATLTERMKT